MTRLLVITGTDTGVGKTHIASLIVRQARRAGQTVGVYKPVCSGGEPGPSGEVVWEDVERLRLALGDEYDAARICPQRFLAPLAPPVAARHEGRTVDAALIRAGLRWWLGRVEFLLIEGAGGLLAPLTETETIADLAAEMDAPLIVVARLGLGTINHTLLTVEAAERRRLAVAGVVLNQPAPGPLGPAEESNPRELAARCAAPLLGIVPFGESETLRSPPDPVRINWLALAGPGNASP